MWLIGYLLPYFALSNLRKIGVLLPPPFSRHAMPLVEQLFGAKAEKRVKHTPKIL